jgi:hypothetical protein
MANEANEALYARARGHGQKGLLGSIITRRSSHLLSLQEMKDTCVVRIHRGASNRTVPLCQILGSENRPGDFDRDFNPLHDRNKGRWLSVATARQRGKTLPPVALIQVGDLFFVRDGHHRISVARALGQSAIEATVEIWQVEGSLPWEVRVRERPHRSTQHHTGAGRVLKRIRGEGARYRKYVYGLLGTAGASLRSRARPRPSVDAL